MSLQERLRGETWRDIAGYEGKYTVSNHGRVFSTPRPGTRGGELAQVLCDGYRRTSLQRGAKDQRAVYVHRLVLEAFVGPRPDKHEAAHLNGNRQDNRVENLAWVTKKVNHSHKVLHGTAQRGEKSPSAKLTECAVQQIRAMYRKKTQRDLALMFGVSLSAIQRVHGGATWNH